MLGWVAELYPRFQARSCRFPTRAVRPTTATTRNTPSSTQLGLAFLGPFDRVFSSEAVLRPRSPTSFGAEHVDCRRVAQPGADQRHCRFARTSGSNVPGSIRASTQALVAQDRARRDGVDLWKDDPCPGRSPERLDTHWAHEYGRELWVEQGGGASFADYLKIARAQHRREEKLRRHSRGFPFCDTTPWTTLHWCLWMHSAVDPRLVDLVERTMNDYDWFVCADDFPWEQDGWREMGDGEARRFQARQLRTSTSAECPTRFSKDRWSRGWTLYSNNSGNVWRRRLGNRLKPLEYHLHPSPVLHP